MRERALPVALGRGRKMREGFPALPEGLGGLGIRVACAACSPNRVRCYTAFAHMPASRK